MKLVRVDSERPGTEVNRLEIEIGGVVYEITERFGDLKIHAHSDEILVKPCCSNEVAVKGNFS